MATAEDLSEVFEKVQREMAQYGYVTAATAEQLAKMRSGADVAEKKLKAVGSTAAAVADAFVSYNKALYDGASANKAASVAMDKTAEAAKYAGAALAMLIPGGPLIKALVAGLGLLTAKALEASKAIADQADQLYTGFQDLAKAGATGAQGVQGVFNSLQKVGLGTEKLATYMQMVSNNSQDLAAITGTVNGGLKVFENTMGGLSKANRIEMQQLGLGREAQAEAVMGYIKQQRMLTAGTKMQMDTSSAAAMRYIKETDELTRITGLNRKEQEKLLDDAMREEMFNATMQEIAETQGPEAMARVREGLAMAARVGPETAKQFKDSLSGFVGASDSAQQAFMSTQGRNLEFAEKLRTGQLRNMGEVQKEFGAMMQIRQETSKQFRVLGQMGASQGFLGSLYENQRGAALKTEDYAKAVEDAAQQQRDQLKDPLTKQMAKNEEQAREQQLELQRLVNKGLEGFVTVTGAASTANMEATSNLMKLGEVLVKDVIPALERVANILAGSLLKALDFFFGAPKVTEVAPAQKGMNQNLEAAANKGYSNLTAEEEQKLNAEMAKNSGEMQLQRFQRYRKNLEARAAGGPVVRGSPYLVGEEGPELFVPSIAGDIVPLKGLSGTTGASLRQSDKIQKMVEEITKDTMTIEKSTDQDAKLAKEYSAFYKTYIELKTSYEKKQMEVINYQQSGEGAAAGGTGLKMPSMPGIASMGGGRGLTKMSQGDLAGLGLQIKSADTQAAGGAISSDLIELAKQVQAGVPGFAGFTAFNDKFHNERAPSSQHTKGLAMDFVLAQKPSKEDGQAIVKWLQGMGASLAIDEYNNPSAGATGGHIHAQIPAFAEGGTLGAGNIGLVGERGPELITGPGSITPMGDLARTMSEMVGLLQQSVNKLDDISRSTQRTSDVSGQMLTYAQN